jgi:hypothetical protein
MIASSGIARTGIARMGQVLNRSLGDPVILAVLEWVILSRPIKKAGDEHRPFSCKITA